MTRLPLLPLLFLLSPGFGKASAQETRPDNMVTVSEGDDALLKCDLSSENSVRRATFDWRKDNGEHEVFMYDNGKYSGSDIKGQSEQFRGRVEFFKDEVASGNASIKIKDTRLGDNGTYTCSIMNPYRTVVNIILNVVGVLKKRNVTGAAPMPYIQIIQDEITWKLLECKTKGVPEPDLEWRNGAGKVQAYRLSKNQNGSSHVELLLNVTKSDTYTCVVNQTSIYHQINNTQNVSIPDVMVVEGDDAILPCSLDSKENIENTVFSWKKDHKEVFLYDRGRVEEDSHFEMRLKHFQHKLKSGNASLTIHDTKTSDSGHYSCYFADVHQSNIILLVVGKSNSGYSPLVSNVVTALVTVAVFGLLLIVLHCKGILVLNCQGKDKQKYESPDP